MKKYKLIKQYPGSPKLGFELDSTWKPTHGGLPENSYYINGLYFNPENHTEFWEEVVEKDYEILQFRIHTNMGEPCNDIVKSINNQQFMLDRPQIYEIYSVKRLKDSEIFTIGDTTKGGIIKKFKIAQNIIIPILDRGRSGLPSDFTKIEKIKKPLFKTEDGVDIFKGDFYCKVNNQSDYSIVTGFIAEGAQNNYKGLKFSTKKKAQEYIIMNKPCLSLNDVAKVYVSAGFEITSRNKKHPRIKQQLQLRELIKIKLKKAL